MKEPHPFVQHYLVHGPEVARAVVRLCKIGDEIVSVSYLHNMIQEYPEEFPALSTMDRKTARRTISFNLRHYIGAATYSANKQHSFILPRPVGTYLIQSVNGGVKV